MQNEEDSAFCILTFISIPMTVHDQLFADLVAPALAELFGEAAIYIEADGTATIVTAQFADERQTEEDTQNGRLLRRELMAVISRSEVPEPTIRGTITRNGEVWPIEEIRGRSNVQAMLRLVRIESIEASRPGFRAKG